MEIFLVRHGIAEEPEVAQREGRGDEDRRLTSEGQDKTAAVAKRFAVKINNVDRIVHSSLRRARETAEIFARYFPEAELQEISGLAPYDSPEAFCQWLEKEGEERLMVVGHEPFLGNLLGLMITGRPLSFVAFRKAGIAGVEWQGKGRSQLCWLLPPKWLL